jgi:hypothetical protein
MDDHESDRRGAEWEDGIPALVNPKSRSAELPAMRHPLIPSDQLSAQNLPAFHVKLTNQQLGHMLYWLQFVRGSFLSKEKKYRNWPADFDTTGNLRSATARTALNPPYDGQDLPSGKVNSQLRQYGPTVAQANVLHQKYSKSRTFLSSGRFMILDYKQIMTNSNIQRHSDSGDPTANTSARTSSTPSTFRLGYPPVNRSSSLTEDHHHLRD